MKYLTWLILFVCLLTNNSIFAQKWSLSLDTGYGFGISPEKLHDGNAELIDTDFIYRSIAKHSYGKGINTSLGVHYALTDNIHIGLGVSYLYGLPTTVTVKYQDRTILNDFRGEMIRFTPLIKIVKPIKNYKIAIEFGGVLGVNGRLIEETNFQNHVDGTTSFLRDVYTGRLSLGVMGGIHIQKELSKNLSLFVGCKLFGQSLSIKESEKTVFTVDGVDKLDELSTWSRYGDYYNSTITENTIQGQPSGQPRFQLSLLSPFNSIGINIGGIYMLDF